MQEILRVIEYLQNYGQALQTGVDNFAKALPIYTKQHMTQEANRKLNSTKQDYLDALSIKMNDYVLLVELDKDNWIANAVESGIGQFDMKEKTLRSPKAKISKKGYRYISIPIGKEKNGKPGKTESSREYQNKINEVLMKPKLGMRRLKQMMDGSIIESQSVLSVDPMTQGLYRTRKFENADDFHGGKKRPKWQFVLFRMMSENPESKSKWQHPGIQPVHIFRSTERWLEQAVEPLMDGFIQTELESMNNRMKGG